MESDTPHAKPKYLISLEKDSFKLYLNKSKITAGTHKHKIKWN